MIEKFKTILVLAPHTDDGELGCGGTIAYFIEQGATIHYIAFSACEQSVLPQFPKNILKKEVKNATSSLGIPSNNLHILDFKVRTFSDNRQLILDKLIFFRNTIMPDLVLIPSLNDIHQDHATIAIEAVRAFKFNSIFSYELPWNNLHFSNTCFIRLSDKMIASKIEAINKYDSQKHRNYMQPDFIKSLAMLRGVQINCNYAEVFEIVRLLL